jgi:hypothetical protein
MYGKHFDVELLIWFVSNSLTYNAWRHGLVKADHYRPIEETNLNSAFINYTACYKLGGI